MDIQKHVHAIYNELDFKPNFKEQIFDMLMDKQYTDRDKLEIIQVAMEINQVHYDEINL